MFEAPLAALHRPSNSRSGTFRLPFNHNCICRGCNGVKTRRRILSSPSCDSTGRICVCAFRFAGEMQSGPIASRQRRLSPSHFLAFSLMRPLRDVENKEHTSWCTCELTARRGPDFIFELSWRNEMFTKRRPSKNRQHVRLFCFWPQRIFKGFLANILHDNLLNIGPWDS